jgi:acylaminoacyl-peptidase
MYSKSPIAHVTKVKAPVFLNIGKLDLRVPPSQGFEFYHSLKALGKKVEMNVYEDNHSLSKVPVNVNVLINTAIFFNSILG